MKEITDSLTISKIRCEGKRTHRGQVFETSGTFDGCYLYQNKLYDCFVSCGWLRVFELEKADTLIGIPDIESHNHARFKYIPQMYDELLM